MLSVITPAEMGVIDAAAPVSTEVLIARAGWAVATEAKRLLGGLYGRRISVVAGKGNNGADGRVGAELLRAGGARVHLVSPDNAQIPAADLFIDAAYGTGLRGGWSPPSIDAPLVLAVDIPSGIDGLTGHDHGSISAECTVTFAALKPGLLLGSGPERSGSVRVVDIGLDVSSARAWLFEDLDLADHLARLRRSRDSHKWRSAVAVVAGSPGMGGAGRLTAEAAMRAGAGMVAHGSPGCAANDVSTSVEAVARDLSGAAWSAVVLSDLHRFASLVVGPGVGRDEVTVSNLRRLLSKADVPTVVDADGLFAVANQPDLTSNRRAMTVLTPHDGEYRMLMGEAPGEDRVDAARVVAAAYGCHVLLKGPTTVIASPQGDAHMVTSGDGRLATAGTGDVLAGMIGARLAVDPAMTSISCAAHWHGLAGRAAGAEGVLASNVAASIGTAAAAIGVRP